MNNSNFGIKKTFDENDFINEFKAYNRMNQFSYEGLRVMFDALNELANDCEMVIEMDVIALCCDYNELSIDDVINDYDIDLSDESFDDKTDLVIDYLHDHTMVLGNYDIDGIDYVLFQSF